MVFLWPPSAAHCWPECLTCRVCRDSENTTACAWQLASVHDDNSSSSSCLDDHFMWRDALAELERYTDIMDAFALNVNALMESFNNAGAMPPVGAHPHTAMRTARNVFRDKHHPNPWVHAAVGKMLFERLLTLRGSAAPPPPVHLVSPAARDQMGQEVPRLTGQAAPPLLAALEDPSVMTYSHFYGRPRFGDARVLLSSEASRRIIRGGKVVHERDDRIEYVRIPHCQLNGTSLMYSLPAPPTAEPASHELHIGLNMRGAQGQVRLGAWDGLDRALTVMLIHPTLTQPMVPLPKAVLDHLMPQISRGVLAPQAWWRASKVRTEISCHGWLNVSVRRSDPAPLTIGGIVFAPS